MGKFVISPKGEKVYFNLHAKNKEVILSSQDYKTVRGAMKGVSSVIRNAPIANMEDQTKENWVKEKNPKFQIYKDKGGEFRFRLIAANGKNIGHSEGYKAMQGCKNGIASVQKNAENYEVEVVKPEE